MRVTDLDDRLRTAVRACTDTVVWHPRVSPGESLAALARACTDLGIDEWDVYGDGGAVTRLEGEVAKLLGKPAAAFFISGTMAQQSVLRVWCDRRGSQRVAIPDLSHLLGHELDGPRLLHGLRFEHLTQGRRTATAADLRALPAGLGAALVELPLRDAGFLVPTWEELVELSETAHDLEVPLHLDGARLWEVQPWYDRSLSEIAALADSVYVSFYKGLGGLAGAVVVSETDVIAELRQWRQRMGGQLYRMTPYAVSALLGLRDRLPQMPAYVAWARSLAAELSSVGLRVNPDPPRSNSFEVFIEDGVETIHERLVALLDREKVQPCGSWQATDVPGISTTEVTIHEAALRHDPAVVAGWYAELAGG